MDDLKSVTLDYLRGLARKHLGPGHSKLTKRELIAALAQFVPALKKLAQSISKAASPAAKPSREPRGKETRAVDKKKQPEKKTAERKPEPEKKAPEKKAPEKKVAEKKVAEKKVAEKKAPEKKASQKKAAERKSEPEKKATAPQSRKATPPSPAAHKDEDLPQSAKPAQVVNFPPRPRSPRSAEEAWHEDTAEMVVDSPELEQVFQHAAEPLVEGFFVARMMGERELRRHHLTEDQTPRSMAHGGAAGLGYDENLGELPLDYGNDLALALARDPYTLFITWDFSSGMLARAREGIDTPRAMVRVFDGDRMVREEEVALESRSFYIHGLPPGRPYRVEAHFIGRDGRSRRIGHSTHPLVLPRTGPSPDTSVRFVQIPPPPRMPVQSVPPSGAVAPGLSAQEPEGYSEEPVEYAEEVQYIQWRRIPLPGSDEMVESSESRVARARQARGEGRRPQYLENPPEYLDISARPPGSSEQSVRRGGPEKGGASEQTHWTPPPSGRGR
jgi:hypothetical protein